MSSVGGNSDQLRFIRQSRRRACLLPSAASQQFHVASVLQNVFSGRTDSPHVKREAVHLASILAAQGPHPTLRALDMLRAAISYCVDGIVRIAILQTATALFRSFTRTSMTYSCNDRSMSGSEVMLLRQVKVQADIWSSIALQVLKSPISHESHIYSGATLLRILESFPSETRALGGAPRQQPRTVGSVASTPSASNRPTRPFMEMTAATLRSMHSSECKAELIALAVSSCSNYVPMGHARTALEVAITTQPRPSKDARSESAVLVAGDKTRMNHEPIADFCLPGLLCDCLESDTSTIKIVSLRGLVSLVSHVGLVCTLHCTRLRSATMARGRTSSNPVVESLTRFSLASRGTLFTLLRGSIRTNSATHVQHQLMWRLAVALRPMCKFFERSRLLGDGEQLPDQQSSKLHNQPCKSGGEQWIWTLSTDDVALLCECMSKASTLQQQVMLANVVAALVRLQSPSDAERLCIAVAKMVERSSRFWTSLPPRTGVNRLLRAITDLGKHFWPAFDRQGVVFRVADSPTAASHVWVAEALHQGVRLGTHVEARRHECPTADCAAESSQKLTGPDRFQSSYDVPFVSPFLEGIASTPTGGALKGNTDWGEHDGFSARLTRLHDRLSARRRASVASVDMLFEANVLRACVESLEVMKNRFFTANMNPPNGGGSDRGGGGRGRGAASAHLLELESALEHRMCFLCNLCSGVPMHYNVLFTLLRLVLSSQCVRSSVASSSNSSLRCNCELCEHQCVWAVDGDMLDKFKHLCDSFFPEIQVKFTVAIAGDRIGARHARTVHIQLHCQRFGTVMESIVGAIRAMDIAHARMNLRFQLRCCYLEADSSATVVVSPGCYSAVTVTLKVSLRQVPLSSLRTRLAIRVERVASSSELCRHSPLWFPVLAEDVISEGCSRGADGYVHTVHVLCSLRVPRDILRSKAEYHDAPGPTPKRTRLSPFRRAGVDHDGAAVDTPRQCQLRCQVCAVASFVDGSSGCPRQVN